MKKLAIIGCSGHGKVIEDIIQSINSIEDDIEIIGFFDDAYKETSFLGYPYLGTTEGIINLEQSIELIIAIGSNQVRETLFKKFSHRNYMTLIHPSAIISKTAVINSGTVIMPGAIVNCNATIGKQSIINSGAIIEHDCQIGDFVHLSPKVALAGGVIIGTRSHMGIGSTVIQLVRIGSDVTIGAGAVVIEDIKDRVTAVGVPAKVIKGEL